MGFLRDFPREIPRKTHAIPSSDEKSNILFASNMVKWAGINLSVIPSDGKPTPSRTELHRFSTPSRTLLYGLSRQPC